MDVSVLRTSQTKLRDYPQLRPAIVQRHADTVEYDVMRKIAGLFLVLAVFGSCFVTPANVPHKLTLFFTGYVQGSYAPCG
jgi:hypothetical protein